LLWQRHFGKFGLFFDKIAHESSCMPDRPDMFGPTRGDDQRGRPLLPRQRHLRQARSIIAYRLVISCYRPIVTFSLKFTVFEIWRHGDILVENRRKTYPLSFGTFLGGDPLRIFRRLIPCQKVESWGYQMVYILRSCFRSARHNTGV